MTPVLYSRNLPAFRGEITASVSLMSKKVRTVKPIFLSQMWRYKVFRNSGKSVLRYTELNVKNFSY